MASLKQLLLLAVVLLVAALLGWGYYQQRQADQARAEQAAQQIASLEQRSARQAQTIVELGEDVAAQRQAQQNLQQSRDSVRKSFTEQVAKQKEVLRNDQDTSAWADRPLPAAARRLHQRPALSGAEGYRQFMSGSQPVPAAAGGAAN